jgi:hypothetical protein
VVYFIRSQVGFPFRCLWFGCGSKPFARINVCNTHLGGIVWKSRSEASSSSMRPCEHSPKCRQKWTSEAVERIGGKLLGVGLELRF